MGHVSGHDEKTCKIRFCYDCDPNAPLAELEWEQTPGIIEDNARDLSRGLVGGTDYGYQAIGTLGTAW